MTASETEDVPKINIICDNDSETQNVVNNIIESWNTLTTGYVNKKPMSLSLLYERIESSDYVAAVVPLTVNGRNPVNLLELFESNSSYNPSSLHDKTYDSLIQEIKNQSSKTSWKIIEKAEKYLSDNGIFYPLYVKSRFYASAPNVSGVIFHPYGSEVDFFYASKKTQ